MVKVNVPGQTRIKVISDGNNNILQRDQRKDCINPFGPSEKPVQTVSDQFKYFHAFRLLVNGVTLTS